MVLPLWHGACSFSVPAGLPLDMGADFSAHAHAPIHLTWQPMISPWKNASMEWGYGPRATHVTEGPRHPQRAQNAADVP